MSKVKSLIFLVMVTLSVALIICGCSEETDKTSKSETDSFNLNKEGFPLVNKKIELTGAAVVRSDVRDFPGLPYWKWLEEKTNVKVNWIEIPADARAEKFSIMFASQDLPDFFSGTWMFGSKDLMEYGGQGLIKPLNDYIDNDSIYFKKLLEEDPMIRSQITAPDGNIYGLPSYMNDRATVAGNLYINKMWLDKVGKKVPKTTDELFDVLTAFKNAKDLNGNGEDDEIPCTFMKDDWIKGLTLLYGSFGITGPGLAMGGEDGRKVLYNPIEPEFKDVMNFFHKLYKAKLIDEESFTQDISMFQSKIKSDPPKVGLCTHWGVRLAYGESDNAKQYVAIAPPVGPSGKKPIVEKLQMGGVKSTGGFVITKECDHPDIVFRWGDALYEEDIAIQSTIGFIGKTIEKDQSGNYKYCPIPKGMTSEEFRNTYCPGVAGFDAILPSYKAKLEITPVDKERFDLCDNLYAPYQPSYYTGMPKIFFTEEESKEMSQLSTEISTYVGEISARWITEGNIDEEWDEYVNTLKSMGIDRYIEINQEGVNRFFSNSK